MAGSWWEDAPVVQAPPSAPPSSGGNWWDAAPVVQPATAATPPEGGAASDPWWRSWVPKALAQGFGDILGMPAAALNRAAPEAADIQKRAMTAMGARPEDVARLDATRAPLPTPEEITGQVERGMRAVGVAPVDAQTPAGRVGQDAVRFATGSVLPGSPLRSLPAQVMGGAVAGATSGVAGEGARALGFGETGQAVARTAGALLPAGAGAATRSFRGAPVRDAAQALEDLTPQQLDQARNLMREAERMGSPITVAEAVQQVAGPNVALSRAQDLAQNSTGGQRVMDPFLTQRNAGATQAVEGFAAPYTPRGQDAAMIPSRVQEQAGREVAAAYQARTAAVQPFYAQAATQAAEPARAATVQNIVRGATLRLEAMAQRDQSGLLQRQLDELRAAFDGTVDWDSINRARRFFRDQLRDQGLPGQPVLDREMARAGGQVINSMTSALHRAVPDLRRADVEYMRLSREVVDPVEKGLIGRISQTDDAGAQRGLLFPSSPMGGAVPTNPEAVGDAVGRLAGPAAQRRAVGVNALDDTRGLLGAELRTRLDEALQLRSSGPTDRPGAASASRLAPSQGREDNLLAAFRALPGGAQAAEGFQRLMDVLGAQTFQPARNSATAGRGEAIREAGRGGALGLARTASNPFRAVPEWLENWQRNTNTEDLARALTTPEGFHTLRALARVDSSAQREALIRGLLTGQRAAVAAGQ